MRTQSRLLIAALAVIAALLSLAGCAKPGPEPSQPTSTAPTQTSSNPPAQPADAPATTPEQVDMAVRRVLQGYLDALKRGSYAEAAGFWSPSAKVTADGLKTPGVTEWHFISSEMIDSTATSANVQLNFSVKVAPNTMTPYNDARNVRYVRLALEQGGWKILSMAASP